MTSALFALLFCANTNLETTMWEQVPDDAVLYAKTSHAAWQAMNRALGDDTPMSKLADHARAKGSRAVISGSFLLLEPSWPGIDANGPIIAALARLDAAPLLKQVPPK